LVRAGWLPSGGAWHSCQSGLVRVLCGAWEIARCPPGCVCVFADGVFSDFCSAQTAPSRLLAGAGSEFALSDESGGLPAGRRPCRTHRVGVRRQGERNVWVADAPNFEARQVTHYTGDDGMPIAALKLTPAVEPSSMRAAASRMTREKPPTRPATSKSEPSRCGPRTWIKAVASRASRACLAIWLRRGGLRGHPDFSQR